MTGFIATIATTKGTLPRTPPSAASSASASALASASASPSATVTTSTSASKSKSKSTSTSTSTSAATASFTPFTARSTIYRRHEARLHRSMEQQGDRRPAMIRVLSLLPGFRTIVPPYDDIHDRHGQAHAGTGTGTGTTNDALALTGPRRSTSTSQTPQLGDYSEETIFSTAAMSSPSSMSMSEPRKHVQQHPSSSPSSSPPSSLPGRMAAQASLATGMAAGAAEFLLRPYATTTATMTGSAASAAAIPFNPFQKVSASTTAFGANNSAHTTTGRATLAFSAAAGGGGEASILAASATPVVMPSPWNTTTATRSMAATTMTSSRALLATTTATSALFGTKVYLEQHFQEENPSSSSSSSPSSHLTMTSVATSSVAGIVSGMIQHQALMMSTGSQGGGRLMMGTKLVGPHMVAATFYFGVYEALRPTTSTAAPPSLAGIAVAGGLAGVVQTSLLNTMRIGAGVRLLPLLIRAAPIHALLFCSYESMRYHCHYR